MENEDIISLIGVFAEDAVMVAEIYTKHSNRTIITKKDMQMALQTRAYHSQTFWSLPNINQRLLEMKEFLKQPDSDSDYEIDTTDETESITQNTCTCEVCSMMNNIEEDWKNFEPQDPYLLITKNAVQRAL